MKIITSCPIKIKKYSTAGNLPNKNPTGVTHPKAPTPPCEITFRLPQAERRINVSLNPSLSARLQFISFISSIKRPRIHPESQGITESQEHEGDKPHSECPQLFFNKQERQPPQEITNELDTPPKEKNKVKIHVYLPQTSPMH